MIVLNIHKDIKWLSIKRLQKFSEKYQASKVEFFMLMFAFNLHILKFNMNSMKKKKTNIINSQMIIK
jgi:hypothetical protein